MIYSGQKFSIRQWQKGDEASLALHANNSTIWQNLKDSFPHPYTYDDAVCWIDLQLKNSKPSNFAIIVDDDPIGSIGFIAGNDVHRKTIEIGYWLSEEYWGLGIISEAISFLKEYIFSNFEINRLTASVFSSNEASIRVLKRNGFFHEATLKQSIYKNGEFQDELIFSIIKPSNL